MTTFKRQMSNKVIQNLKREPLFNNKILKDINTGKPQNMVFPAIRKDYIDFYYKGGRLFEYKEEFKTHKKYLSLINSVENYFSESQLANVKIIKNFQTQYSQIKSNCKMYPGVEATGVSYLYSKYSYFNATSDVVVLDIEIAFKSDEKGKSTDRIDLLLYHKKKKSLGFVEAKHFSNSELWSTTTPKCIKQVQGYNKQIQRRKAEILNAYRNYVQIIKNLFGITIPSPKAVEPQCGLYVFGFDRNQQTKFDAYLNKPMGQNGIKYYSKGNEKSVDINALWSKLF